MGKVCYPENEAVEQVIKDLQAKMRIQDWTIIYRELDNSEITGMAKDNKAYDSDLLVKGYTVTHRTIKTAMVYLNTTYDRELFDAEWYELLVHEMLHILEDELQWFGEMCLQLYKDMNMYNAMRGNLQVQMERFICCLTTAFLNAEGKRPDGTKIEEE